MGFGRTTMQKQKFFLTCNGDYSVFLFRRLNPAKNKIFFIKTIAIQNFSYFCSIMRIVSHRRLVEFYNQEGHGDSKVALERWYDITEQAEWKNLSDIKAGFPATDYVGNQHYVFNIKGNKYRLVVVVKFTISHVFIRFVGTHKEYEKIDASTI
jgi:mRNA interferase HigB